MKHFKRSYVLGACMFVLALYLISITACQAENKNGQVEKNADSKASLLVSLADTSGAPLSGFTAILTNTRMTMTHKTVYSGYSPFEVPIGSSEKWQVVITDYAGETVRVLKYETDAGSHRVEWDLSNESGEHMEDGVYFLNVESPSVSFFLGSWGIWNYSEPKTVMPLLYKKVSGSSLELGNLISAPDTLDIFQHHILHLVEVGTPYTLRIFKDGYKNKSVRVELTPGKKTELSVSLTLSR